MEETEFCQFSLCAKQISITISKRIPRNILKNVTVFIMRLGTKPESL